MEKIMMYSTGAIIGGWVGYVNAKVDGNFYLMAVTAFAIGIITARAFNK